MQFEFVLNHVSLVSAWNGHSLQMLTFFFFFFAVSENYATIQNATFRNTITKVFKILSLVNYEKELSSNF